MENMIIVFYVAVGKMRGEKLAKYMRLVAECLTLKEPNVISYFIPVTKGDTRVECINPKLLTEDEYAAAKSGMDRARRAVDEFIAAAKKTKLQ